MIPLLVLQLVTFAWNANPPEDAVLGYRLVIDQTISDVGDVLTYAAPVAPGTHQAALLAYSATAISAPSPVITFVAGQDPCGPPLGSHAPAVFLTSVTVTTGRPGSRSFLSFQLAGPDPFIETAVQVDGADASVATAVDARNYGSQWFTQPAVGTHTVGLRIKTSFGCELTRGGVRLVVK